MPFAISNKTYDIQIIYILFHLIMMLYKCCRYENTIALLMCPHIFYFTMFQIDLIFTIFTIILKNNVNINICEIYLAIWHLYNYSKKDIF